MSVRERVFRNVEQQGWHYHRVLAGPDPSYSYSIGFEKSFGSPEVVMAGTIYFFPDSLRKAFRELADRLRSGLTIDAGVSLVLEPLGEVTFGDVHPSWSERLLLGDLDFYAGLNFRALQLLQAPDRRAIDTPDMSKPFDPSAELPWRWLVEEWPHQIPESTRVFTDLDALRGQVVTMISHDAPEPESTDWQALSLSTAPSDEVARIAPFGTLLAVDPTIGQVLDMPANHWATREDRDDPWFIRAFEAE